MSRSASAISWRARHREKASAHSRTGSKNTARGSCDTYLTSEMNLYFLMYARHKELNTLVYSHTATEIDGVAALVHKLVDGFEDIQVIRLDEINH